MAFQDSSPNGIKCMFLIFYEQSNDENYLFILLYKIKHELKIMQPSIANGIVYTINIPLTEKVGKFKYLGC